MNLKRFVTGLALTLPLVLSACGSRDIQGVKTFDFKSGEHKAGPISYPETPPAGGPHNPTWQNCGVYDRPIYDFLAVHALEHGAVWIAYRPDLASEDVDRLRTLVDGRLKTLLAPYPGLKSPVVITAWNNQLAVDSASDERLKAFLDKYEDGPQTPERGAACTNGSSETR
ncbi:DUF3105 domain-containing protein [Deinococcus yavapaiensis]|uniref:DUF3105 domain-containing protein n=1 Tax=Deinococcus yavapaiensis TaxID=309889 RepID=UPI001FE83255|nr:DUF3105 domain-containing protein [Deinococcus yavapaiensis]